LGIPGSWKKVMGTGLAVVCYILGIPIGIFGFVLLAFGLYSVFAGPYIFQAQAGALIGILGLLIMVAAIILMWAGNRTRKR
jgi:hypothetical protein